MKLTQKEIDRLLLWRSCALEAVKLPPDPIDDRLFEKLLEEATSWAASDPSDEDLKSINENTNA